MSELALWIDAQARRSSTAVLRAISAAQLVMERPGLGQRIVPAPGSVLASPVRAHYDPDPDYFFHWFRDAAVVIDALRVAFEQQYIASETAFARLHEFVDFSLKIRSLTGQALLRESAWRERVQPQFRQFLRPEAELAGLHGDAVMADARVNANGTLDITRWGRPQTDGPAASCLALMRWLGHAPALPETLNRNAAMLLEAELAFTLSSAHSPSVDIWEEENGQHYYTLLLHAQALSQGSSWLAARGLNQPAAQCSAAAHSLELPLQGLWDASSGYYRSRMDVAGGDRRKELDMAVILAMLHAARSGGPHSVEDPKAQATLTALEALFEGEYAINRTRPQRHGIAMGRYPGDHYYSGGAYYFSTLAAAEFYFRLAAALASGAPLADSAPNARFRERLGGNSGTSNQGWDRQAFERGDSIMRTVRAYTPPNGELSEQFDGTSGAQTSAKQLSWSYAAFITAAASRQQADRAIRG
jgi:glucoamylase